MDTEASRSPDTVPREVQALMRLLTTLNAGAMLALCLWLASAAVDYSARRADGPGLVRLHGCDCTDGAAPPSSGRFDVAVRD